MFKRSLVLIYGLVCYVAFLATFLYAIGFVSNLLVPHAIDSAPEGSFVGSLVMDLVLLTIFALQHSVMARPRVQALVDAFRAGSRRAQHVCARSPALALILLFVVLAAARRQSSGTIDVPARPRCCAASAHSGFSRWCRHS